MNLYKAEELIKKWESLQLTAYPDPGTGGEPWTIGWGHTKNVCPGQTITEDDAERFFEEDFHEVLKQLTELNLSVNENQFNALASFVFNVGINQFKNSTMFTLISQGKIQDAAAQFDRWVHAKGKRLNGLVKRRAEEKELFLS